MLDINLIREKPERVRSGLLKRLPEVDFSELLAWDAERRRLIARGDELKARRNTVSSEIPKLKKLGQDASGLIADMKAVSREIKELDGSRGRTEGRIRTFIEALPNIPDEDVKAGGKENNDILRVCGERPSFEFEAKDHMSLVSDLGLIDYERGVKLGGNGYWVYRGKGALLEWALINYFIEQRRADGYELILLPHILNYACGYTAGQFPKFEDDVFLIQRPDAKKDRDAGQGGQSGGAASSSSFLLPTSETALASFHRDEILREDELPKKYFSFTPCYRREAGSYRTGERGMIRGHQFNKVEMFQYTLPEDSERALEELLDRAEGLVRDLGLHYRIAKLAAGDCSAAAAKTYDVEVWVPSMQEFKEVSSVSNTRDYQARRGNMRLKRSESGKNEYLHTLNASGLATSRLFPALCEQFQQADGSVVVPEVLQKWTGFSVIEA